MVYSRIVYFDIPMPERSVLRIAAPGVLIAALCLLPFLGKAFTIDDPVFLKEAHQALQTPLTPAATSICWDDIGYARPLREIGSVGLLMGYLLIPAALLDDREWVAHLIMLLLVCASVIATVSLALRLGATRTQATLAGVFYASCPVILAMAGTVMPDVPAAVVGVIGIERLMAWKADRRISQAVAAAMALGLAPVARSHTLLLLPIGVVMLLSGSDSRKWSRFLPIPLALICFAAFTWITTEHTGAQSVFPGGPNAEQFGVQYILPNALEFGMNWLAVTPFAIAWLLMDGFAGVVLSAIALLAGVAFKFVVPISPGMLDVLGCAGWIAVGSAVWWALRSRRFDITGLALCLLITVPMIPYKHLPSRYIAPCLPAAAILLGLRIGTFRWPKLLTGALVASSVAVGCLILDADAALSGMARRVVAENVVPHVKSGGRAWYSGQWALTWYGEKAGAGCLAITEPHPRSGDLVVAGEMEGGVEPIPRFGLTLRLLRKVELANPGVRIMNPAARAGFYGNSYGYLPWRLWSDQPVNTYYVWEVE